MGEEDCIFCGENNERRIKDLTEYWERPNRANQRHILTRKGAIELLKNLGLWEYGNY